MYGFGMFAFMLAMSGLPTTVLAGNNSEGHTGGIARADLQTGSSGSIDNPNGKVEMVGADDDDIDIEGFMDDMGDEDFGDEEDEIHFDFEDDDDVPATSFNDLKQKIEMRKQQLAQEVASTSLNHQKIVENTNPVRVAVHSLLSSKELLGGIGPEVSKIAKEMNNSVATTTNAEVKIQSRGFFTRFFFGGDSAAADVIVQEVAQNQQHIDELTAMLDQANVPADIQAILRAQIAAIQDAQVRLQDLAQKEQTQWGLFSWRF